MAQFHSINTSLVRLLLLLQGCYYSVWTASSLRLIIFPATFPFPPSLYLRLVVKAQHRIVILTEQSRHIVISSRPPPPPPSSSLPRESQHFFIVLCPAFYRENEEGDGNDMILYIISPPEG